MALPERNRDILSSGALVYARAAGRVLSIVDCNDPTWPFHVRREDLVADTLSAEQLMGRRAPLDQATRGLCVAACAAAHAVRDRASYSDQAVELITANLLRAQETYERVLEELGG